MVLIGGVKYACERCIRGHRVTTCNHTDQPLIMIKPKGRPSTQCKHCKNLRVAKNAHSSGACVCGKNNSPTSTLKKKKCGCETGKTCDCHKKKQAVKRTNSLNSTIEDSKLVPSSSISSNSSPSTTTPSTITAATVVKTKRVGEVTVPINEYIPSHSSEIGTVLNERAVSSFFQDVPLPFEPGHGLLDLFEKNSHHPTSHLNHYDSSQYSQTNDPNRNDFGLFQNLAFSQSPSNDPLNYQSQKKSLYEFNSSNNNRREASPSVSDNASEHSGHSFHSSHTVQSKHTSNSYNLNPNDINRQSSGLFGTYDPFQSTEINDSKVEVLSLTASFNDIIPDYGTMNDNNKTTLTTNNSSTGQQVHNDFIQSQQQNGSFTDFDRLNFQYSDQNSKSQLNNNSISNLESLKSLNSLNTN